MRKAIGWGLLAVGVVGLGLWARADHAPGMEAQIAAAALPLAASTQHAVTIDVAGRDIRISGLAEDDAERARLVETLQAVEGRRRVIDTLEVVPLVSPYPFDAQRSDGGTVLSGAMPSAGAIDALSAQGFDTTGLTLANGEPDGWAETISAGLAGLANLEQGALSVTDRALTLHGAARTPSEASAARAALSDLPAGINVVENLEILDDGTPFRLELTFADGAARAQGKLPSDLSGDDLARAMGLSAIGGGIEVARIGAGDPFGGMAHSGAAALAVLEEGTLRLTEDGGNLIGTALLPTGRDAALAALGAHPITAQIDVLDDGTPFVLGVSLEAGVISGAGKLPAGMDASGLRGDIRQSVLGAGGDFALTATVALDALRLLETGTLAITESQVTLTGAARTPRQVAAAERLMAALPEDLDVILQLSALDDGTPFALEATLEGGAVAGSGKLPSDLTLAQVAGDFEISRIGAGDPFGGAANAGIRALRALEVGSLSVTEGLVALSGAAADPTAAAEVEAALSDLPEGWRAQTEVSLLDDGLPIDYSIIFDPVNGVRVSGKAPRGLDADTVAEALDFEEVSAVDLSEARTGGDPAGALGALAQIAPHLAAVEGFGLSGGANTVSPGAEAAGGVSPAALGALLPDWEVVATRAAPPQDGSERVNLVTGAPEVWAGVAWVPLVDFAPDLGSCTRITDRLQENTRINFLSGSADLDAASVAVVNRLAAVARVCADAGLRLYIGGHTDNTGSAEGNLRLSEARALAVARALSDRGMAQGAMSALGFGQSSPIATNETEEGRAANRRTSLRWIRQ